jgi:predicted HAD superfamily Cof-like phosphohydrolase
MTDAEHVREFTGAAGQPTPATPSPMDETETKFISKMILDEVMELMATHWGPLDSKRLLKNFIDSSKDLPQEVYPGDGASVDIHRCAGQADALVDVYYYSLNAACKKGMNLSAVFELVHAANMAKKDAATGTFLKRADGKIIKPKGWAPPDVEAELMRQRDEGAWKKKEKVAAAAVVAAAAGATPAADAGAPKCPFHPPAWLMPALGGALLGFAAAKLSRD